MKNAIFNVADYAKIDLHLHLDGSVSPEDIVHMAEMEGVDVPKDIGELRDIITCPESCDDLNTYLQCFSLPVSVMQTHRTIAYAVESLVKRLDSQGLIYAEIRYAPQKHMLGGLSQEQVIEASLEGLNRGMAGTPGGIKANIILSCMRDEGNDHLNMETVELASQYLGKGVCATDLAGAEALYPTANYRELFARASQLGLPFTIHAGEADGTSSMRLAIEYGASRIGHGIRAWNDPETKALLRERDICLEFCPTSNMQTKALAGVTSYEQYPLQSFLDDGIAVCINTDNMTVSGTTVELELRKLQQARLLTPDSARTMLLNAINHAFISEAEKEQLRAKIRNN